MASRELVSHVEAIFQQEEHANGQTDHTKVAGSLVGHFSAMAPGIARDILRMPTHEHLYDGAESTLAQILAAPDDNVVIWTQGNTTGQLWKIATSGITHFRKEHGRERFGVHVAEDKIATLPTLMDQLAERGVKRIILVDDKAQNVESAAQVADAWKRHRGKDIAVHPVWINQGRTLDQVPPGYTSQTFAHRYQTISDISGLRRLQDADTPTAWLVDWDHTLNNTTAAKQDLFETIAQHIEREHPHPLLGSHVHDLQARVVGALQVTELPNGMSGRRVIEAQHQEEAIVVKHAPHSAKELDEIRGIQLLQHMPHAAYMPRVHYVSEEEGVIAMEKVHGQTGREKLQTGDVTIDDIRRVDEVIDMKLQWLAGVLAGTTSISSDMRPRSMQREEFEETKLGILQALREIATSQRITVDDIGSERLFFNGKVHLSFFEALDRLGKFYADTTYDRRFPLHGDVSWGNMIFGNTSVHIIDGEWTGLHDPAEAYARLAKVISTTTAPSRSLESSLRLSFMDGRTVLEAQTNHPFSDVLYQLQQHMLKRGAEFVKVLHDPRFMKKLYMYLAGSYARELAIANRRQMGASEQIFALTKCVEMVELAQVL